MGGNVMTDNMQTSAIMTAGMRVLRETLGLVETEIFITTIKQERFDYTEWRRDNLYEDMTLKELVCSAAEFERQHPELIPKNAKII
jgi:ribosomal protein S18 acetylase RimI-like enzyme